MSEITAPLALYVHWPFCVSKCPYCDFNSHVRERIDEAAWRDALIADMEYEARLTPGRRLSSLFFGGGTPSLMSPETVGAIIDAADRLWGFENAEITLEANPSSVEAGRFAGFAAAGVNRVSLGLQALDDAALKALGRAHDLGEGLAALDVAQRHFPRVSFDLIYAREGQTPGEWEAELTRALAFGTEHLSLYQLTIEPGTAFAKAVDKGRWAPAADDLCADMFDAAQEMTAAAGLPAYEISNHAAAGEESRHNLVYWTYGDYSGVGPGAHGRLTEKGARIATETPLSPKDYLAGKAHVETALSAAEATMERLSMGLRLHRGIPFADGDPFFAEAGAYERLDRLIGDGLLEWDGRTLAATANGRRILNRVLYELFG